MGFFIWMQRRAMGQAGNIMSIGRSRAKNYNADKPSTTFADVAGYEGVKQEIKEVVKIKSSRDAYNILSHLEGMNHEQFWCIYLKRNNQVIKDEFISKGGISGTIVDIKLILKTAINLDASGIVLCHNHPSGEMRPSSADIEITNKVKEAARLMDINIVDHIIIGNGQNFTKYYSFADEGII